MSILVVDLGTYASSVAIATADQVRIIPDPVTGSRRWPSSAARNGLGLVTSGAAEQHRDTAPGCYVPAVRRALDSDTPARLGDRDYTGLELATEYLRAVAAETERQYGGAVDRLVLTVPAGYRNPDRRRELILAAASAAGFPAVEVVSDVVAASTDGAAGLGLPADSLVLVCDLGATWTVALVRQRADGAVVLAEETSGAGRDVDQLLLQHLRLGVPDVVEPLLAQGGDAGLRALYQATDFVRQVKHQLSEVPQVSEQLPGAGMPYQLTRAELERFAEPALRWLMASCRAVVALAGVSLVDVAAVVLAGGGSRLPAARMMIHTGLGRPVWQADDPELTVVRGAAAWAGAVARRLLPDRPKWRVEPLCWTIPDGQARLARWLVGEGVQYPAGATLAQVRTADDRVYDLVAEWEGALVEHRVPVGAQITTGTVAATVRFVTMLASGSLTKRHHLRAADWLLCADRRRVVECGADGRYVRMRDVTSGAAVAEARANPGGAGRVCAAPDGRLTFVAWDGNGDFVVWDVLAGRPLGRFKTPDRPAAVLIDEDHWRIVVESSKRVQVGRYRRDTATVWDLRTGELIEELVGEDLHRRCAGLADRTAADAFAVEAVSPDGRLRAVALPAGALAGVPAGAAAPVSEQATTGAGAAVSVCEAATGREVFRADGDRACAGAEPVGSARVGFTADGRHLVVNWRSTTGGWIDVWDV